MQRTSLHRHCTLKSDISIAYPLKRFCFDVSYPLEWVEIYSQDFVLFVQQHHPPASGWKGHGNIYSIRSRSRCSSHVHRLQLHLFARYSLKRSFCHHVLRAAANSRCSSVELLAAIGGCREQHCEALHCLRFALERIVPY